MVTCLMLAIETGKYRPEDHKRILLRKLNAERQLLADPQRGLPLIDYRTDRADLWELMVPEINKRAKTGQQVRALELGAGEGVTVRFLADKFKKYPNVKVAMTSLTSVPQHEAVKASGATVYTGVLAERLPAHWENGFDVIGTDSMLGYTDIIRTLTEIRRSLKPGGVWLGIEGFFTPSQGRHSSTRRVVINAMRSLGMQDSAGLFTKIAFFIEEDVFTVKYVKPE